MVPGLKTRYEEVARAMRNPKNWLGRKKWSCGQALLTSEIAQMAGVSIGGVHYWISQGRLPARRMGLYWVVLKSDFRTFVQRAVNGKYVFWSRTREKLCQLLLQLE